MQEKEGPDPGIGRYMHLTLLSLCFL
jgi:hypothetical protein